MKRKFIIIIIIILPPPMGFRDSGKGFPFR